MSALAFFDFDRTLTRHDSGELIALAPALARHLSPWAGLRFLGKGLLYKAGRVSRAEMQAVGYATYAGAPLDALVRALDGLWERRIAPDLRPPVLERLHAHAGRGEPCWVLTASPTYVAAPAKRALPVAGVLGTRMEVRADGRLTGRVDGAILEGAQKAEAAARLAEQAGLPLAACWAYTDSIVDLALLEAVGHPVAAAPDGELRKLASARGWEVLE